MNQLLIFIGSSLVLVPIFQKFGFGSVIGYLTAGILVGPDVLNLIHDSGSVFHLAELGVVLLLFMIGLEIRPSKLLSMRRELLSLGGVQVFATSLVFTSIAMALGMDPLTAGIIGFSLSLSSTAFAIQTLTEKNEFNTEYGRSSFSVLLMQDLVAIPALAIIPVLAGTGQQGRSALETFALIPLILGGLIIVSRYLISPIFRTIASTKTKEMFTAITLFIVLGVGALMQKIGLSAALGAFLAGVLLADSEYRLELEANLEPFKGLLMGLFFISVGMEVDLDIIASRPIFVFTATICYIAIKGPIIYGLGRWRSLGHVNSKLMAMSIFQGGEFAFVIFGIASSSRIISKETIDVLTVLITLSMALGPLLYLLHDKLLASASNGDVRRFDEIKDESPEVIIAGFGRFGQIFGRILRAQKIPFVAIDHDPDSIEVLRKFNHKVYYGDASRLDLLESAGAGSAKYFILAVDEVEGSIHTAKTIKEHFPNLKVFARARNRGHAFELMEVGVEKIKRETFESAANFVKELLFDMGYEKGRAETIVEKFKVHDETMLGEQFKVRKDEELFMSVSNQGQAQLQDVLLEEEEQSYINPVPT